MNPLPDNQDIFCYLVNKHSTWKVSKYKRVFSFGTHGITTYNPDTLEVTNRWLYSDILAVKRVLDKPGRFTVMFRKDKNKKSDCMYFSSEHRAELLSVSSQFRYRFAEKHNGSQKYEAQKHHWSGTKLPIMLDITPTSLDQLDATTNLTLAKYDYKDIEVIYDLAKVPHAFVIVMKNFGRMHLFVCPQKEEIKRKMEESSQFYLGLDIKMLSKNETIDYFLENKFGKLSGDEYSTSLTEFSVEKYTSRSHQEPQQRLLCITQSCLVERDPETYNIVTLRPLTSIFALIRDFKNPRQFTIEYTDMAFRTYNGSNRDSILATILEGARGVGNKDVHVKMKPTNRGKRWGPYYTDLDEDVEAVHLRLLKESIGRKSMSEIIERFNANVPYSGLLHSVTQDGLFKENKERPIQEVLSVFTAKIRDNLDVDSLCDEELEALYHTIRRLIASKIGFGAFTQLNGFRESLGIIVVKGLNRNNEAMTLAAVDMICALMRPMHDDYDLKQEQHNKSSLLAKEDFLNKLLDRWTQYVNSGTGALVVAAMLDMLTFALCMPYSETTEGTFFDALLQLVAKRGRCLFKHFQHPCVTIVKGASLLMRAIIEEGETEIAKSMQELALSESALPRHLLTALFTPKTDPQRYTQCKLSRQLVGLWLANNENGMKLLKRLLPSGLLAYLESKEVPPLASQELEIAVRDNLKLAQDHANKTSKNPHLANLEKQYRVLEKHIENTFEHWGARIGKEKRIDKMKVAPVVLRKSRQHIKSSLNWPLFYYKFNLDHSLPNLIWNHKTRDELRNALDREVKAFDANRELTRGQTIAWNYAEFEVIYSSLKDHLCIDGYYIKVLLDCQKAPESLFNISNNFFNNLYHRFLVPTTSEIKCMCLEALAIVYDQYHESIGYFSDTKHIVNMLERTIDRLERDRLLLFLKALTRNKENVKDIIVNSPGITILVDLMTLAHLHTSRAYVPTQSNVIEFGNQTEREQEKEWHYCNTSDEKKDDSKSTRDTSVSFKDLKQMYAKSLINQKTKCWAQGMHNWRPLQSITQLKWTLVAKGSAILNESDLAITILSMLIRMIEYYPSRNKDDAIICPISKIKEILSSENCIHHIVQLLLTFDPIIVEKVATLLCHIAEDNIYMPKLYTTGVFYFILMYNGSNVLPIARFLKLTHSKQTFRGEEPYASELMQRSILGQLLPEAMVNYLENHGPEKFAQIFLGEYDTPEAIWSSEMRYMLIQKIAAHIADFTPRLWSNNKAQYQYIVIPVVKYPQLMNELFCNIFYLRHLCDTSRFPDWPINDPVNVLRDVLEAWTGEVEKKPPPMSCDEAYAILNLAPGQQHDEPIIRKAYYSLAQKYHPDKNSQGRTQFEAVNKAYDFLCSRSSWTENKINTNNIILILQTQSILFDRYSKVLQPYKYAGYKQLIKTIQLEANDEQLFSKQTLLLQSAIELIYHTIKCSALNAEEFNRENGFQVTLVAFERCVSILTESSHDSDSVAQICLHCTKSFTIAATFPTCRETFQCLPNLVPDLLRVLHFKNLIKLNCAVVECVSALSVDSHLQASLLNNGILWYLLSYLFLYDFTLEECGIESTQEDNQQKAWNEIAKLSIEACAHLCGCKDSNEKSPYNSNVKSVLSRLLTPYLANMIMDDPPQNVLKILTSNCETPYLIWDNATRAELTEFLEQRKAMRDHSFEDIDFASSVYSSELVIGGIFIRIYNEQPAFKLNNVKGLVLDILDFLKVGINERLEEEKGKIVMALTAFYHIVQTNQDVAIQCIGQMKLLFSMLMLSQYEEIQVKTLLILSLITRIQECVNDVAAHGVLLNLLLVMYSLPSEQSLSLNILHNLITSSSIVKEILAKGGIQYLLDILLNSRDIQVKTKCAEVLGRLMEDKVSGQRVKLTILHALPDAICDALVENGEMAINIMMNNQENPEIIWNDVHRQQLSNIMSAHCKKQYNIQKQSPTVTVQMPDLSSVNVHSQLFIGGVYLHLYNNSPTWTPRKPVKFLSDLLDAFEKLMMKPQSESLEPVGNALVNLLTHSLVVADEIPSLGHLPKLLSTWRCPNVKISKHLLKILNLVFANEACVSSVSQIDCLTPIKQALTSHPEFIDVGCDCLSKLFSFRHDSLVKLALEVGLINFLLRLLGDNLSHSDNPARAKAFIVKALKSMTSSLTYGPTVDANLNKSPIWSAYSEQKHDLFITNSTNAPYLTGPTTAGYLTQGSKPMPSVPPPVEDIPQK